MMDKEKLHHILSSLWKNNDSVGKTYYNQALQDVQMAIDFLQEEPVSEDLEEEITKCYKSRIGLMMTRKQFGELIHRFANWQKAKDQETIELAEDHAMLAGMEKMKEQMMKDAVDGFVIEDIEEGNGDFLLSADYLPASMGLKDQQKVKVIVIKED